MDIRNCNIKYRCPKSWHSLEKTSDDNIKFCHECEENVYYCSDKDSLLIAMQHNHCVAIPINETVIESAQVKKDPLDGLPEGLSVDDNILMGDILYQGNSEQEFLSPSKPAKFEPFDFSEQPQQAKATVVKDKKNDQ